LARGARRCQIERGDGEGMLILEELEVSDLRKQFQSIWMVKIRRMMVRWGVRTRGKGGEDGRRWGGEVDAAWRNLHENT
jgi:hypothetical protein